MKNFFHKYKILILCVCAAALVLTTAFFAGGSIGNHEHSKTQSTTIASSIFNDKTEQQTTQQYSTKQTETVLETTTEKSSDYTDKQVQSTSKPETVKSQDNSSVNSQNSDKNTAPTEKHNSEKAPETAPKPVEPQEQETKDNTLYCSFSILCSTVLENSDSIDDEILSLIPQNGIIFNSAKVKFSEGESVFDVLQRVCRENKIHLESKWTPIYNSAYIEGINNLYEFDCGENSGWKYCVNGLFPNYGCSRYQLKNGDAVKFLYTCDGGDDIGSGIF